MPIISEHTNSEGERITINKLSAPFEGQYTLSIWDDPPPRGKGIRAPMLLDQGTQEWLKRQLEKLKCNDTT